MTVKVALPYGPDEVHLELAPERMLGVFGLPSGGGVPDEGSLRRMIGDALDRPIGTPPLGELAAGHRSALIVCDDVTRPTPGSLILPEVVARLNRAGIPDEWISVLFALGTHRGMTPGEMEAKLGAALAGRLTFFNHDACDRSQLVDLGVTPTGVPISVNRRVVEAELVIGVGSIVPHRYCGWSGGAKIIQPGVSGEETTLATHLLVAKVPDVALGAAENTVRREMDTVARQAGLSFIVNTVLDAQGTPVSVVAGDFVAAHREGVARARKVCGVRLPQAADVVIASSHPCDLNFWQAGKAFYSAEVAVKPGGTVILVSPLFEGIGEHVEFASLIGRSAAEIEAALKAGEIEDVMAAAAAFVVKKVMAKASVRVVTDGLSPAERRVMGIPCHPRSDLQGLLDRALEAAGPDAKAAFLPEGPEVLPRLEDE